MTIVFKRKTFHIKWIQSWTVKKKWTEPHLCFLDISVSSLNEFTQCETVCCFPLEIVIVLKLWRFRIFFGYYSLFSIQRIDYLFTTRASMCLCRECTMCVLELLINEPILYKFISFIGSFPLCLYFLSVEWALFPLYIRTGWNWLRQNKKDNGWAFKLKLQF